MAPVRFIEKPLKVLKNTSGLKKELFHSSAVHSQNIPILVSSQVLRSRSLGQVDVVCINARKEIEIYEVKSSEQGSHLTHTQYRRLTATLIFLTAVFALPGRLKVVK